MNWPDNGDYHHLLERDPGEISLDGASRGLRNALMKIRTKYRPSSLEDWLDQLSDRWYFSRDLEAWLAHLHQHSTSTSAPSPPSASTPTPDSGWSEVEDWLEDHGLHHLFDTPVAYVPDPKRRLAGILHHWRSDHLSAKTLFILGDHYDPKGKIRRRLLETLQDEVRRADRGDGEHRRLDRLVAAGPPPEEGLHDLWNKVVPMYKRLVGGLGTAELPPGLRLTCDAERNRIGIHRTDQGSRMEVDLNDLSALPLDHRGVGDLIQILLAAMGEPDHPDRSALVEAFGAPQWLRHIQRIDRRQQQETLDPSDDKDTLVWRVSHAPGGVHFAPEQARRNKAGNRWVTRKATPQDVPLAMASDPVDRTLLLALRDTPNASKDTHLLAQLVGHPRVLGPDRKNTAIEVRRVPVRLVLSADADHLSLRVQRGEARETLTDAARLLHDEFQRHHWVRLTSDRLTLAPLSREAFDFLGSLSSLGSDLPLDALPEILRRLPAWSRLIAFEIDPSVPIRSVDGDPRPVVQLDGDLQSLRVTVRTQPLPDAADQVPGEGPSQLYGMQGEDPVVVHRDLAEEQAAVREAWAPIPLTEAEEVQPWIWAVSTPTRVLEVLMALREHNDAFRIGWTDQLPVVRQQASTRNLSLVLSSGRDWFGVEGSLEVDGQRAALDDVIADDQQTPGFFRLKDGSWAALTRELTEAIRATADTSDLQGRTRRITPLHGGLIDDLQEAGVTVDVPETWTRAQERVQEARTLEPRLPDGLNAELRPYQVDGFRWLASLAHWAPGAVLADDMGLGKTLQTIALLLRRAADGPALVVVPTSLGFNWQQELTRFAPSLQPVWYHGSQRAWREPQPGEVWITTWGVLVLDADTLAQATWHTAVFDEAHAIKNPHTRRARAARKLPTDFRLALTGTPLENHLGELWSLFDALVPGLLGTQARFHETFRVPIEAQRDTRRRKALSRLIQPFLLRRTKREVAQDLPDRIEIIHRVARSGAERALYEQARRSAVSALSGAQAGPADGRFQFLAALQHLRQLACHPALVDPGTPVASSKLAHVRRLAHDLKDQGHQMLIFSQFTSHLDLVQPALTSDGLRVVRLDGSTPTRRRQQAIETFQAGDADAFLISLKAGGVGLNLTAATYVLHLDPWWNPAAEDQATDRAHRIGQTRSVTVIRVVAQGTIEEQILSMHADKRALASEVLAGTGDTSRLDVDALRALLDADPASLEEEDDDEVDDDPSSDLPGVQDVVIATPSPNADDTGDWLPAFLRALEQEGKLSKATLRTYTRTATHLRTWHGTPLPQVADALHDLAERYIDAIHRGEVTTRSDAYNAKTVARRMAAWLQARGG